MIDNFETQSQLFSQAADDDGAPGAETFTELFEIEIFGEGLGRAWSPSSPAAWEKRALILNLLKFLLFATLSF